MKKKTQNNICDYGLKFVTTSPCYSEQPKITAKLIKAESVIHTNQTNSSDNDTKNDRKQFFSNFASDTVLTFGVRQLILL